MAVVKERVELYLFSPLWAFMACYMVYFTFTFDMYMYSFMGPGVVTSRTVSGSIPGGVTGDFFRSYRQNHVPWGRLSL